MELSNKINALLKEIRSLAEAFDRISQRDQRTEFEQELDRLDQISRTTSESPSRINTRE